MRKLVVFNIKASFALILFLCSSWAMSFAQELSMSDARLTYEKDAIPAIQVIMEPPTDAVKKAWEDYMKDEYDVKMKGTGLFSNKDVLTAEEVIIEQISPNAMNFYTRIVKKGANTEMSVFASLGYDLHINEDKYPREYLQVKKIIQEFLNSYLPAYYEEQVEEAKDNFNDLTKDRSKLEGSIADNAEKIKKLTKENEKMSAELASKKEQLSNTSSRLDDWSAKLKGISRKLKKIN